MSTTAETADSFSAKSKHNAPGAAEKPVIAITIGDPAGIGPEVVLKAVSESEVIESCTPVVIGDRNLLEALALETGLTCDFRSVDFENLRSASLPHGISLLDLANVPSGLRPGELNAEAGRASGEYIEAAVEACSSGFADAVVTAPINKRSFNAGGYDFPGHTEFLAFLTDCKEYRMSFFAGALRVVLLSTHVSLGEAISLVKHDAITSLIRFTDRELGKLLGRKIKIALSGLNPHASEGGMFGSEESEEMEPAVLECREQYAIDVSGPYSPDTIYVRGFQGEFDAVIACYHDQATIAVKCLSFGKGVNVTLGLPIIRTSVDHGTAYEIAGQKKADHGSLISAIKLAADLANLRMVKGIIR